MVPSKAGRTLRLALLAVLPVTVLMWLSRGGFEPAGVGTTAASAVTVTAIFQTLLLGAVIWMATITSQTIRPAPQCARSERTPQTQCMELDTIGCDEGVFGLGNL